MIEVIGLSAREIDETLAGPAIPDTDMKKYKIDGEKTGTFLYTIDNGDGSTVAQQSFLV